MPMFPYWTDGYFYAMGSAFFGGSWQPITKSSKMASLHPAAKLAYFSVGIFVAAWMNVLLDQDLYVFTAWGLASGALLIFTLALNVTVVIPAFGVAKSTSILSGLAVCTSVGWNYILGSEFRSQLGCWAGVAIVIVALGGMVGGKEEVTERSIEQASAGMPRISSKRSLDAEAMAGTGAEAPLVVTSTESSSAGWGGDASAGTIASTSVASTPAKAEQSGRGGAGFSSLHLGMMTLVCGAMAGSILVPMDYSDQEFHGIVFLPSMAIGGVVAAVPVVYGQFWIEGISSLSEIWRNMRVYESAPHGMLTGALYGVAVACNIKAIDNLDYATAMVLMQMQICVAGAWGIVLYGELKGKEIVFYYMWGTLLVAGALTAGYYGTTN